MPILDLHTHLAGPAKLLAVFVLLAGIPLGALGWLGWRLLEQDRALENQRERDRLENAAGLLERELDRSLASWEGLLPAGTAPPGGVLIVFDSRGVLRQQGMRMLYYPRVSSVPEAPAALFADAEALEFRENGFSKATAAYRRLALSRDHAVRAAALMRLARSLRKQNQIQEAIAAYGELAASGETIVAGSPAELLARRERIELLGTIGDEGAAKHEAELLASALSAGRYLIDRPTFEFYSDSAPQPLSTLALASAVEALWPSWQQQPTGRAGWTGDGGAFASVWSAQPARGVVREEEWRHGSAIVASVETLAAATENAARSLGVRMALEDPSGRPSWRGIPARGMIVTKTFRETGLPWTIRVVASNPTAASEISASRRKLMETGFGLMVLVIAAAGYLVFRAVSRELSVARLQSDFVAAVSHEFRSPLTAMRHLTEMLEEGETPPDRMPLYFRALGKETRRLQGMVESLLDFGRMEAGRRKYHMEDTTAVELSRQVVEEFSSPRLELHATSEPQQIHGDREALTLALRNLLDNAMKYSPESSPVSVSVERHNGFAGISVQDQGAGIPKGEQRDVFRKFVRGSSARTLNVKGTGIGLAMARQIVKAHGGRLELASEPGHGSRFTILLPVRSDRA